MALRSIRFEDDEILRKKSKKVKVIDQKIKVLIDDMVETMYHKTGVGLAAVQIGSLKRIIIVQTSEEDDLYELINPEILEQRGSQIGKEGCLSVPGISGYVERPEYLKLKAFNRDGEEVIIEAEGFLATVFSHELDHLEGVLYIDKIIPEDELEDIEEDDDDFENLVDEEMEDIIENIAEDIYYQELTNIKN